MVWKQGYKSIGVTKDCSIIEDYVKSSKTTFNSSSIAKFIKQEFNMSVWKQSIAKFLKRELRMSYRKASSRPTNAN